MFSDVVVFEFFRFIFILGYAVFFGLLGGACGYLFRKYLKNRVKKESEKNEVE